MEIKSKQIELVATGKIIPWDKNANKHTEEQIEKLCELIKFNGFRDPLIVSKRSGFLICGHGRLLSAKKLGIEEVPVIFQDFESEAEEYQFMVSHNAINANNWGGGLDLGSINHEILDFGPDFNIDLLAIKDFSLIPDTKFEMEDELKDDMNKKYLLEIQFPNDMEMMDIHDDLVSRGYIVKVKNK